jgi:CHAT domain-containing protein
MIVATSRALSTIFAFSVAAFDCFAQSAATPARGTPSSVRFFGSGVPPLSYDGIACEAIAPGIARRVEKESEDASDALSEGRTDAALSSAGSAIRLLETCGGLHDIDLFRLANLYLLQARAHASQNRIGQVVTRLDQFSKVYERLLALTLRDRSEREASLYYVNSIALSRSALTMLARIEDPAAARVALQIVASRNGRLMEMSGERARLYRRGGVQGESLLKLRSTQVGLVLRGKAYTLEEEAGLLSRDADSLGVNILYDSNARSRGTLQPLISVADLQAGLGQNEAVLVYALVMSAYDPLEGPLSEATSYAAWVMTRETVTFYGHIGESEAIDKQVKAHIQSLRIGAPTDPKLSRTLLRDSRIGPTVQRLRILPSGGLFELPFASLAQADGRPLWQRFQITYATYLRDAVRARSTIGPRTPAAVFGVDLQITDAEASIYGSLSRPNTLTERFGKLDHAESEARTIGRKLGVFPDRTFTGVAATEAAVKSVAGPAILHVAAHGGNIPDNIRFLYMGNVRGTIGSPKPVATRPATNFAHTYLAMAEYPRRKVAGREDGVLSDYEMLGVDLEGTLLAVASACSTGLGYQLDDEGIYSMRTAFSLAGARAQLVSLWTVDDVVSRSFMEKYYDQLQQGHGTIDAFFLTQAQFAGRSDLGGAASWLSFTISGDNVSVMSPGPTSARN